MRMPTRLVLAIATTGLAAGCAAGSAPESQGGPEQLTIVTRIDLTADPYQGTFEVTDGAGTLGCSTGTFVDTPTARGIHKEFTCESGARTGKFTAEFSPPRGPWEIVDGTGDFSGLSGRGTMSLNPAMGDIAPQQVTPPGRTPPPVPPSPAPTTGEERFVGQVTFGR